MVTELNRVGLNIVLINRQIFNDIIANIEITFISRVQIFVLGIGLYLNPWIHVVVLTQVIINIQTEARVLDNGIARNFDFIHRKLAVVGNNTIQPVTR